MNTCKHCGFIGEAEDFVYRTGSVCKKCHKRQQKKRNEKHYKNNKEKITKQKKKYRENNKEKISKYNKEHQENNKEKISKQRKKYRQDNHEKILEQSRNERRKKGELPWSQIKHLRLGLYIEQTIATMFGSVQEVVNNPGVDFICPSGYKIQVKTASITYNRGNPRWNFHIEKNKMADYFILVAVNHIEDIDRDNFRPVHIWMMKGYLLSHKMGTGISPSRVSKWDKYSITEEYESKFINSCNAIKEDKQRTPQNE